MAKARMVDAITLADGRLEVTIQFQKTIVVTQRFIVPAGTKTAIITALTPLVQKEATADLDARAPTAAAFVSAATEFDV